MQTDCGTFSASTDTHIVVSIRLRGNDFCQRNVMENLIKCYRLAQFASTLQPLSSSTSVHTVSRQIYTYYSNFQSGNPFHNIILHIKTSGRWDQIFSIVVVPKRFRLCMQRSEWIRVYFCWNLFAKKFRCFWEDSHQFCMNGICSFEALWSLFAFTNDVNERRNHCLMLKWFIQKAAIEPSGRWIFRCHHLHCTVTLDRRNENMQFASAPPYTRIMLF